MNRTIGLLVLAAAAAVSGCDTMSDVMGTSKYTPDERAVRTHQTLAMPPDLQLRAPNGPVVEETGTLNPGAQTGSIAGAPGAAGSPQPAPPSVIQGARGAPPASAPVQPAPPGQPLQQVASMPPAAPAQAGGPQALTGVPQTAGGAPAAQNQSVYARFGISEYHPNGKKKSDAELLEELRKKRIELERQKNPNYGTILNIGNAFGN